MLNNDTAISIVKATPKVLQYGGVALLIVVLGEYWHITCVRVSLDIELRVQYFAGHTAAGAFGPHRRPTEAL